MRYLENEQLLRAVMSDLVGSARKSLWVATANLKNVHLPQGRRRYRSILHVFDDLVGRGVTVRVLCSGTPSQSFQDDLDRFTHLFRQGRFDLRVCPRSHFKTVIADGERAYLGSANVTGAGLGAKHASRRNFEVGLVLDEPEVVRALIGFFESIWDGGKCGRCGRREHCSVPLDTL